MSSLPANQAIAILTGGQSQRMGQDKALLPWAGGTLLDNAVSTATCVVRRSDVMIVGDRPVYHSTGVTVVEDDFPGSGPIGGIATALDRSSKDKVLVVAVDMPTLSVPLIRAMVAYDFRGDVLVPRIPLTRENIDRMQVQPLHAIYRKSALRQLIGCIRERRYRLSDALERLDVVYLDEQWIRQHDPELRSFQNANTRDEFIRISATDDDAKG